MAGKLFGATLGLALAVATTTQAEGIIHDADYYILLAQSAEAWAVDDLAVDQRLEDFRQANGGRPPNIISILIDDVGFGDDTHEKYPVSTEVGARGGQEFVRVLRRHLARKQVFPDQGPATGMPYQGIENLRPESVLAVEQFLIKQASVTAGTEAAPK